MIAEQSAERFTDLEDGPEELGREHDGMIARYDYAKGRFVMVEMPEPTTQRVGVASLLGGGNGSGSGGTSTIAGATDFTNTTGAGTDGFSVVWDQATSKFVLVDVDTDTDTTTIADATDFTDTTGAGTDGHLFAWDDDTSKFVLIDPSSVGVTDHGALSGKDDDDHPQYLLADGSRAGASSSRQVFTSGITTGSIRPASDSATAAQIQNASGTAIVTVDTTNSRTGIGVTPAVKFHASNNYTAAPSGLDTSETIALFSRDNSNAAIAVTAGDAQVASIYLGDQDDIDAGSIRYFNNTGALRLTAEDTVQMTRLQAGTIYAAGTGIFAHINRASWTSPPGFLSTQHLLVVSRQSSSCGIGIQGGASSDIFLVFGDSGDMDAGAVKYRNSTDEMKLRAGGADEITIGNGTIGFDGSAASAYPTVTGSRGGNAALASLLTALDTLGLITDSSS